MPYHLLIIYFFCVPALPGYVFRHRNTAKSLIMQYPYGAVDNISVIGGGKVDEKYCKIAREVGFLLAARNIAVICGGLTGVMKCVAKAVKEAGGISVGILPGYKAAQGNEYLTVRIPSGIGLARDFLVVRAGDAVIAIDGSTGTKTEAYFALSEGKSVISIGNLDIKERKPTDGMFFHVETAEEAVDIALKEAEKYRNRETDPADFLSELK